MANSHRELLVEFLRNGRFENTRACYNLAEAIRDATKQEHDNEP